MRLVRRAAVNILRRVVCSGEMTVVRLVELRVVSGGLILSLQHCGRDCRHRGRLHLRAVVEEVERAACGQFAKGRRC